jgi:hypothetical protein
VRTSKSRETKGCIVLPPPQITNLGTHEDNVKKYLEYYTDQISNLHVYWGDALKFSEELRRELDTFEGPNI